MGFCSVGSFVCKEIHSLRIKSSEKTETMILGKLLHNGVSLRNVVGHS